jgi:hypothetical protein
MLLLQLPRVVGSAVFVTKIESACAMPVIRLCSSGSEQGPDEEQARHDGHHDEHGPDGLRGRVDGRG